MRERICFKSDPLTLTGRVLSLGMPAPRFTAVLPDLSEVVLPVLDNKIKLITSFPSLDTPVCDLQVKEFNKQAAGFTKDVSLIAVSMDLPFAQKRFCDLNSIASLSLVSDYRFASFGLNYGLLVKELGLLGRSVLIIDRDNILRYIQVVEELTHQPDYDQALAALADIISNPSPQSGQKISSSCLACHAGAGALLSKEKIQSFLKELKGWEAVETKKISKKFSFENFSQGKSFLDAIAAVSDEQGHHPYLAIGYNGVTVTWSTHSAGGLTENDFIMAGITEELVN